MLLTSNDSIKLEELYRDLKRNQQAVNLEKTPVENAMGFDIALDFIVNVDIDVAQMVVDFFKTYLEYRLIKQVFIKKPNSELEPIDTEILEDKKELENLGVDKDTELYIEYKKQR